MRWSPLLHQVLDGLMPAVCPLCQEQRGPYLCASCEATLPRLENPCAWCGAAQGSKSRRCSACDNRGLAHLDRVCVEYAYDGTVAALVTYAKAAGRPAAVTAAARCMPTLRGLSAEDRTSCVVTVVPPSRGRRPGRHLGTACARSVAQQYVLPFRRLLTTTRLAAEQHVLSPGGRRANVDDLFRVIKSPPSTVVLVDDLLTTGATLSAAASCLRRAGCKRVIGMCLARTPRTHTGKIARATGPTAEIV